MFLSNTFVYEPILLKFSMNANIVKIQIFHEIKCDIRGRSMSQIMTFLIKNSLFLLFMLLINWGNQCRWTLWKNKVWLIQRQHLPCFNLNLRSYRQLFVLVFFFKYRSGTFMNIWKHFLKIKIYVWKSLVLKIVNLVLREGGISCSCAFLGICKVICGIKT